MITVRLAQPADAEDFSRISIETFALASPPNAKKENLDAYIDSELTPQKFKEYMTSAERFLYAAEVGKKIAGFLGLSLGPAPKQVTGAKPVELQRIYVLPEHHGAGVAQAIMQQVFTFANENHHDVVWLGVCKQNQRGIAFYGKNGFVIVGEQLFKAGDELHEDLIMMRPTA